MSGLAGRLARLEAARREKDAPLTVIKLWIADEDAGVWRDSATGEAGNSLTDPDGPRGACGRKGEIVDILISYGEGARREP